MLDTIKSHPRLSLVALAGIVVFAALYKPAFMSALRSQPLARDEITRHALQFAANEGLGGPNSIAWTVPIEGDEATTARAAGTEHVDRESLPDPAWETTIVSDTSTLARFFSLDNPPTPMLSLALTPSGEVVQYVEASTGIAGIPLQQSGAQNRQFPLAELDTNNIFDTRPEDRLAAEEDRGRMIDVALAFFERHGIPVEGDVTSAAIVRPEGSKVNAGHFEWRRPGSAGLTEVVRVVVLGDRVAAYDRDLRPNTPAPPKDLFWNYAQQVFVQIAGILYIIVAALILVLVVLKQRQGEINLRITATVFGLYFLFSAAWWMSLVGIALSGQMVLAGNRQFWFFVLPTLFVMPVIWGTTAALAAGAWAVGESESYVVWPQHLVRPMSAAVRGRFRSPEVVRSIVVGYLCAFAALGAFTLVGFVVPQSSSSSTATISALTAWPAMPLPAAGALTAAIQITVSSCMFVMTYTRRILRRMWVTVLAGTLSTWLLMSVRPPFPLDFLISTLLAIAFGFAVSILFVRWGALAVFAAVFAFFAILSSYPLVLVYPHYTLTGLGALLLAFAPVEIVAYGALRPRPEQTEARVPPHIQRALDRLRIGEEFEVARRVQFGLLPAKAPWIEGLDIAGTCVPANEVGGDYFDYFRLDANRVAIAVGDVSGKGVGAAIYMTLTKSYMITQASHASDPVRVLSRVNSHLKRNLARGTFVTMTYAVVDAEARRLVYTRAGHNPPLLLRADGEGDFLNAPGLALGSTKSRMFETITKAEEVELQPGDLLVLYTDGVTEAMNLVGEEYGDERLVTCARDAARTTASAAHVVDAILKDVRAFAGRAPQHDDITIVIVRVA